MICFFAIIIVTWVLVGFAYRVLVTSISAYFLNDSRREDYREILQGLTALFLPSIKLTDVEIQTLIETRIDIEAALTHPSSLSDYPPRSIHRMHAFSRVVLLGGLAMESAFAALLANPLRLFKSKIPGLRKYYADQPTFLHAFVASTTLGLAKPAFTEEPRFAIHPRSRAEARVVSAKLKQLLGDVVKINASWPPISRRRILERIVDLYIHEIKVVSDSASLNSLAGLGVLQFPIIGTDHESWTQLLSTFSPSAVTASSANGHLSFIQSFRNAVDTYQREKANTLLQKIGNRQQDADPRFLFFWNLLLFLKRELDVMPSYRSASLAARRSSELERAYQKWHSNLSALSGEAGCSISFKAATAASRLIKAFYKATGRGEQLSIFEKLHREFGRDFTECAEFADDAIWENLRHDVRSSAEWTSDVRQEAAGKPLEQCFSAEGLPGEHVWDINRLLLGDGLDLVSRLVAWCATTEPPAGYDRIVGIARSGVVFGSVLAIVQRKAFSIAESEGAFDLEPMPSSLERLLIVDDCVQSGFSVLGALMMFARKRFNRKDIKILAMAKYEWPRDLPESSDCSLPLVDGSRVWQGQVQAALTYKYKDPKIWNVSPEVVRDGSARINRESIVKARTHIEDLLRRTDIPSEKYLSQRLKKICRSESFFKADLLYDYPLTILQIGRYYYEEFVIRKGIDILIAGSTRAIPFVVATCLFSLLPESSKKVEIITVPRYRRSLMGLKRVRAKPRMAIFDTDFRSRARLRYIEDLVRETIGDDGLSIDLGLSLFNQKFWPAERVKCKLSEEKFHSLVEIEDN